VGAGVTRAAVGLDLDDPSADKASSSTMDEIASEQLSRDRANGTFVERSRKGCIEVRHERMI
jgi:hypothetical protein